MSLNCILKSADVFKLAISIAPVTNWRYYDSIYTEIYNGLPQNNPEGYDQNSPINFADRLKGKLLIVHGSADDNVHMQNAMEMIRQLVNAGKQFDMMIYPDKNHSILGEARHHLMNHCIDYVKKNL
jgi:dipeptidyl-peptidase-4